MVEWMDKEYRVVVEGVLLNLDAANDWLWFNVLWVVQASFGNQIGG